MNTFHLTAHWYQGMHTYCNLGEEKDHPPVDYATKRCERIVHANTLEEAKQKFIDYVWNERVEDRYRLTEWAVKKDRIYVEEKYEHLI